MSARRLPFPARRAGLGLAPALLLLLVLLPMAQAAEQPREVPTDLRNGQSTDFGTITMEPYVPAGKGAVPVEAHLTLRDLGALTRAETVMLALNLHSREASLVVDGLWSDADGQPIAPLRTGASDDGLQAQIFVSAHEVLSHAADGSVALTFRGQATPRSNGQIHVGALVVAYASDWATVRSDDGPAQIYAYSLVQSTGAARWPMPFHGEGNTFLVVPFVVVSVLTLTAGGMAVQVLRAGVEVPVAATAPAAPARPAAVPLPTAMPPNRRVVLGRTETELAPANRPAASAPASSQVPVFGSIGTVPVFGSPVSPVLAKPATRATAFRVSSGPMQGPLPPPDWKGAPSPSDPAKPPVPAAEAKPASAPVPTVPVPSPAKPPPPPKHTLTAVRRPKRPAAHARPAARSRPAARPAARPRKAAQPSR